MYEMISNIILQTNAKLALLFEKSYKINLVNLISFL